MIVVSESQKETNNRNNEALNMAKHKCLIGFWNVRTMFASGKLAQVTSEMRRYKLDILGISECRWTGSRRMKTSTGETVLYSGRRDDLHQDGVAIILKRGMEKTLMEWKPVSSRIIMARFKGKQINVTILQCYAPTNDAEEEIGDSFYEQLQQEYDRTPKHDVKIIMGDLNAKIGSDNVDYEHIMGKHGCGTRNENGERLIEFCSTNNLVVGGTIFPHKEIHKLTWYSPNLRDKNQIDHLMINSMWRRSLLDVKVKRGADVGSDHHLVTAILKLKLRSTGTKVIIRKQFNTERLRSSRVQKEYTVKLENRFKVLQDLQEDDETIDQKWEKTSQVFKKCAEDCIGYKDRVKKKDWITQETWKEIENRRLAKSKVNNSKSDRLRERYQQDYNRIHLSVKKLIRQDKRKYMDILAENAEEAAGKMQQANLYKITRQICGKFNSSSDVPIKDKDGRILTSEKDQEKRWTEHFKEILNRPPPENEPTIEDPETELDISTDPPETDEIITSIKDLKNGKAPGIDNLNAELFKANPIITANILQPLFCDIWRQSKNPTEWNKGKIIKIPKKGDLSNCNNWRGITLLSIPSKILAKIIIKRISNAIDSKLRNEQAGFRKGKGCIDQIFILRNIIEQCNEWQRQLHINFVDFEKAFDSLHRNSLWKILRSYGIPTHLIKLVQAFYENFECSVGNTELYFPVKTGVRQGCVMSSTLFVIAIDWIMRQTINTPRGIRYGIFTFLEDLDFADDLALLSHTHQHLQEKTSRLQKFSGQIGLKINIKKTEVMVLNNNSNTSVQLNEENLKICETFTYLGSTVKIDGGTDTDINKRLAKARAVFSNLNRVWKSSQYTTRTKLKLYNSCVLPTLLYGSECWRMTENDQQKLSTFHTKSLRRIMKIFWPNKISNDELLRRCQAEDMSTIIKKRRWRWIGHVLRKDPNNLTKTALHWTPEGKRRRGRPKITWRRTVEAEMKDANQTWGSLLRLANDRQKWKDFVAAPHARKA